MQSSIGAATFVVAVGRLRVQGLSPIVGFTVGTDFSGLETVMLACKRAGLPAKLLFASESHPDLHALIQHEYPHSQVFKDISARDNKTLPQVDMLIGGPPCQSWSSAGRKQGATDDRGKLLFEMLAYVTAKSPKVVVIENVPNLKWKFSEVFLELKDQLVSLKYVVKHKILNTRDHGIPQSRRRLYVVAVKD